MGSVVMQGIFKPNMLPLEEKKKVKNTLLNVLAEPSQNKVVKNFKAGSITIANARSNTIKDVENTCTITKKSMSEKSGEKNKVISNEIASIQSSNNKLDNTVHTLSEALSSVDEAVIRGSGIKAYDLIQKKKVISGFNGNNYFVNSYSRPNNFPHNIRSTKRYLLHVTLIALDAMLMDFAAVR